MAEAASATAETQTEPKSYQLTARIARCATPFGQWIAILIDCPCGAHVEMHTAGPNRDAVDAACKVAGELLVRKRQVRAPCPSCGAMHYVSAPLLVRPASR